MRNVDLPLIVGAGPVGRAAALFLSHGGVQTRLIERETEPSRQSKALAVNPRTLEILDRIGLAERLIEIGMKVRAANLWRNGRIAATIDISGHLESKYPFMLAASQAATERLLEEALIEQGGFIERDTQLAECQNESACVRAKINTPHGTDVLQPAWLLAADGAHSTVREQLGIPFSGSTFRRPWELADVPLDVDLAEDHAHAFLCPKGEFQFLVRVIDPELERTVSAPLWRIIGNRPHVLDRLTRGRLAGPPIWTSQFTISHRMNRDMSVGNVHFAGDAAHVHSPIGARGMNLGIEDAWVFAQLAQHNELSRYRALRSHVDRRVVRQVEFFSRIVACEPSIFQAARPMVPLLVKLGLASPRMMAIVTGTDHPLDEFQPSERAPATV